MATSRDRGGMAGVSSGARCRTFNHFHAGTCATGLACRASRPFREPGCGRAGRHRGHRHQHSRRRAGRVERRRGRPQGDRIDLRPDRAADPAHRSLRSPAPARRRRAAIRATPSTHRPSTAWVQLVQLHPGADRRPPHLAGQPAADADRSQYRAADRAGTSRGARRRRLLGLWLGRGCGRGELHHTAQLQGVRSHRPGRFRRRLSHL